MASNDTSSSRVALAFLDFCTSGTGSSTVGPHPLVDISPARKKLGRKTSNHDYPAPVGSYATIHDRYPGLTDLQLQDVGVLLCHV